MKFRKKPIVVEAVQYKIVKEIPCKFGIAKESNAGEIAEFMQAPYLREGTAPNGTSEGRKFIEIETLEGVIQANLGDYIIKGIQGEFYPCKPDIFKATYEKVDNTKQTTNIHINVSVENAEVAVEEIAKKLEQMFKEASQ